jgi:hypothetical protein
MDFPDLSKLPPWAAFVFVICLAVIYVVSRTGWLQGLKSTPSEHHAEVAAVIVDPAALNAARDAVLLLNTTMAAIDEKLGRYLDGLTAERNQAEKDQWLREELLKLGIVAGERRRPVRRPRGSKPE